VECYRLAYLNTDTKYWVVLALSEPTDSLVADGIVWNGFSPATPRPQLQGFTNPNDFSGVVVYRQFCANQAQ